MSAFNPLDKLNLGISIRNALLEQPIIPLETIPAFKGAGIYAIYYAGIHQPYAAYQQLAVLFPVNPVPIYVGKADPPGTRVGRMGLDTSNHTALYDRLRQQATLLPRLRI